MTGELERLRVLALAANESDGWHNAAFLDCFVDGDDGPVFDQADTAFIEAMSPAVALRLLDAGVTRLDACPTCGSRDRWLHYSECGHYYGGASLGRQPVKRQRTNWSNVVMDEGDEAP